MNEADTKAKLVEPKLRDSGWKEEFLSREYTVSAGRVLIIGDRHERRKPRRADYVLRYQGTYPIAIVEAKAKGYEASMGLPQAKDYAEKLDVLFAYATNGLEIIEFDFDANKQASLQRFPTPEELWQRRQQHLAEIASDRIHALTGPYCDQPGVNKLRYYQEVAVNRSIERILRGQKRLLLAMATGTGKTDIAFQIAWKLWQAKVVRRVLFLADRIFLRDQAHQRFSPFGDARDVISEGKVPKTRDIYFSLYQSLYSPHKGRRLYEEYPPDFFDLLIVDECHRSIYGDWKEIFDHFPNAIHLGMTATPKRTDNIDTYKYFGEPVYSYSLGQGIEDGYLATYQVHAVRTNVDKEGVILSEARARGADIFVPPEVNEQEVYRMPEFEKRIELPDRSETIVKHLAGLLRRFGETERTIVYCVSQAHARYVARLLQDEFSSLGYSDYAVPIISEEPEGQRLLEKFKDSDKVSPVVATTVDLLATGVDVPSARNIVFIKCVGSQVAFKQIVGRGSRIDESRDKFWFRAIDYTNATRLFDDWDKPPQPPPPPEEGPRDHYLNVLVVDVGNQTPIENVKVVVQIAANERDTQRTDDEGKLSFRDLPNKVVEVFLSAKDYRNRRVKLQTQPTEDEEVTIELSPYDPVRGMVLVKGISVKVEDQKYLVLEHTGQQLTVQEYIDYSQGVILKRVTDPTTLRNIWLDDDRRKEFIEALKSESVHPEVLRAILDRSDADAFDIVVKVAFGLEVRDRDDRADSIAQKHKEFIDAFGPDAREVILHLIDKYRIGGVEDLSPEVFRVYPFSEMGFTPGVVKRFGSEDQLTQAINHLKKLLYEDGGEAA